MTLQNSPRNKEEIKKEIRTHFDLNKTENTFQNLWDANKMLHREKFRALTACIIK